jgi:hypothetical protein
MSTQNLVPRNDGSGSLGTSTKKWGNAYFNSMSIDSTLSGSFSGSFDGDFPSQNIVSSSQQIENYGFITSSGVPDLNGTNVISQSMDNVIISGSLYGTASYVLSADVINPGVIFQNERYVDNNDGTLTLPGITASLYTNPDGEGLLKKYSVEGGTTGVEFSALTNDDTNYITIDYNGGSPTYTITNNFDDVNGYDVIPYLKVYRLNSFLHILIIREFGHNLSVGLNNRFIKQIGLGRESGLTLTTTGSAGTSTTGDDIAISSGYVWSGANRTFVSASNTQDSNTNLYFCWESGSAGNWNIEANYDGGFINNAYADTETYTTQSLTNGRYNVNWIYRGVEEDRHIYLVLGDAQYTSVEKATTAESPSSLPEIITSHALLVGRIVGLEGTGSASDIASAFTTTLSPAGPIQNHNELSNIDGTGTYHITSGEGTYLTSISGSTLVSSSVQTINNLNGTDILSGSMKRIRNRSSVTSSMYTVSTTEHLLGVDTTNNAITLSMPSASNGLYEYIIKDEGYNASSNNITIESVDSNDGFENGNSSITINTDGTSLTIYSNGNNAYFTI